VALQPRLVVVLTVLLLGHEPHPVGQQVPVVVRVSPPGAEIGDVVRVEVTAPPSAASVEGRAGARRIVMQQEGEPGRWFGLLGIDIDTTPGPLSVSATASGPGTVASIATATLDVRPRTFTERRLRVAPRMASPSEADLARARSETARLEALFRSESAPIWQWPFTRPVSGRVTSTFGTRTWVNGRRRGRHIGVDLAGAVGTPIVAPNAGRIALADELFYTGHTVVIDHGGGLFSFFGHLSRVDVVADQVVERGALVGAVGSTGRVTGPHLHWSMRISGARVDPLTVLTTPEP
jgi:hypothetical protein